MGEGIFYRHTCRVTCCFTLAVVFIALGTNALVLLFVNNPVLDPLLCEVSSEPVMPMPTGGGFTVDVTTRTDCLNRNKLTLKMEGQGQGEVICSTDTIPEFTCGEASMNDVVFPPEGRAGWDSVVKLSLTLAQGMALMQAPKVVVKLSGKTLNTVEIPFLFGTTWSGSSETERWCGMEANLALSKLGAQVCGFSAEDLDIPDITTPKKEIEEVALADDKKKEEVENRLNLIFGLMSAVGLGLGIMCIVFAMCTVMAIHKIRRGMSGDEAPADNNKRVVTPTVESDCIISATPAPKEEVPVAASV